MIILKSEKQALDLLSKGKVLVLPSESSCGLSCLANNQNAVDKIFAIKKRNRKKSLLVVVSNTKEAKKYLRWSRLLDKLAKKYWPGHLTVVAKAKNNSLARGVIGDDDTLALRVTNHPTLRYLSSNLGWPLVSTSANISGQSGIYDINKVINVFEKRREKPDAIFDYRNLFVGTDLKPAPTTIISVVKNKIEVLRRGELDVNV